jgi:hypothetical protein
MPSSGYFLAKAAQCRRLVSEILAKDDPAIQNLLAMAAEFEGKAIVAAEHEGDAVNHTDHSGSGAHRQPNGKDEAAPFQWRAGIEPTTSDG